MRSLQPMSFSRAWPPALVLQPVSRLAQPSLPPLLFGSLGHHGRGLTETSLHPPFMLLVIPTQAAAHQASLPSGGVSCVAAWQEGGECPV